MIIAIDGACKGNGKPGCVSAGSAFIKRDDGTCALYTAVESGSTNQRGELKGLLLGLAAGLQHQRNLFFITDSEYIFNTITKDWFINWRKKGWITANNEPVKNRDLWEEACSILDDYDMDNFSIFHIKGHLLSIGSVTASRIIEKDATCSLLYEHAKGKLDLESASFVNRDKINHALEVFYRNHGYSPPADKFKELIICNTVADIAASYALATHLSN